MLAEILSRMEPVTAKGVSQGDTLPDSSHIPLPEQRCHLPGHRGDLPCPLPTSECSLGNLWPASNMLSCSLKLSDTEIGDRIWELRCFGRTMSPACPLVDGVPAASLDTSTLSSSPAPLPLLWPGFSRNAPDRGHNLTTKG